MAELAADDDGAMALDGIDFSLDGIEADTTEVDLTYSLMKAVHTEESPVTENGTCTELVDLFNNAPPLSQFTSCTESVNQSESSSSPVKTIDELSLKGMESVSTSMEVLGSANLDDINFDFDNAPSEASLNSQSGQDELFEENPETSSTDLRDKITTESLHENLIITAEDTSTVPPSNPAEKLPMELNPSLPSSLPVDTLSSKDDNKDDFQIESASPQVVNVSMDAIGETKTITDGQQDDDFEFDFHTSKGSTQSLQQLATKEDDEEFDFEMPSVQPKAESVILKPTTPVGLSGVKDDEFDFDVSPSKPSQPESDARSIPAIPALAQETAAGPVPSAITQGPSDAEDAWDKVVTVVPTITANGEAVSEAPQVVPQALVSNREFVDYCQRSDWQVHLPNVRTTIERRGFSCLKHFIFGPPKLRPDLSNERDMVFCLAASPLNNNEQLHVRVLQTIFRKLTGTKFDCARYGSHWEDIGFQGNDPATDLRSVGILSLMQILHLVSDARYAALARDIYSLSTHETQNFPFCIMGINMTRIALLTLREGSLNKECNRQSEVLSPFNDLYVSIYLHLYQLWKSGHKTIADTGFVLKDVEDLGKKSPKTLLDNLRSHIESSKKKEFGSADEGVINFMDVCAEEQ